MPSRPAESARTCLTRIRPGSPVTASLLLLTTLATFSACVPFRTRDWAKKSTLSRDVPPPEGVPFTGALVGIGASGGGSRAARFEAAVYRKLWEIQVEDGKGPARNLMGDLDYLSSVSGGSIAAAWYTANKPAGSLDPAAPKSSAFWDDYKQHMEVDLEAKAALKLFKPVSWFRLAGRYSLTDLMAEQLDESLYKGISMGILNERARDPGQQVPHLMINATLYRDPLASAPAGSTNDSSPRPFQWGRKLVHTPLDASYFMTSLRPGGHAADLEVLTPTDLGADADDELVSRAVMSSAAFPIVFAPLQVPVYRDPVSGSELGERSVSRHLELGDGGLYDNFGVETLVQLFSAGLLYDTSRRALIVVIDGQAPYLFDGGNLSEISATIDILGQRARSLSRALIQSSGEQYLSDACHEPRLRVIWVSWNDPGLTRLDPALHARISAIGTRLSISHENAAYLDKAADLLFSPQFHSRITSIGTTASPDGSSLLSLADALREGLKWAGQPAPVGKCPTQSK